MTWRIAGALFVALGVAAGCSSAPQKPATPNRVMVLGIDGGTWRVIEPMLAAGQLPHIKKLYDEGLHGILESKPPILSPVVWTTIFTGFDPDTHGVSDWKTSQSTNRRVPALWELTRRVTITTDVFNVPGSWPPEPIDGVMLSGFPLSGSTLGGNTGEVITGDRLDDSTPMTADRDNLDEIRARAEHLAVGEWTPWFPAKLASRPHVMGVLRAMRLAPDKIYVTPLYRTDDGLVISEPTTLRAEISAAIGTPYIPEGPGWSRWAEPDTPDYLYPHLEQVFDIQTRAALQYAGGDWGLFLYVMTLVDRVSHAYWAYANPGDFPAIDRDKARRYESAVGDAYRATDEALGKLLAAAHGTFFVVVVSDHGFGSSADTTKAIGVHNPDGIYMVWGPRIAPHSGARASIEDVTPTVLYIMGLPVGRDMAGKPIPEVTADLGWRVDTIPSVGTRAGSDKPVDASTWEQLRGLGYVEGTPPRPQMQDQSAH